MRKERLSPVFRLVIVVTSILVACAFAELGLRFRDAYPAPVYPPRSEQPDLYQPDPLIGYRLWPSIKSVDRYPRGSQELIPVVSNSDGFRNSREFDTHDGRPRILVIGDSFVFGLGVPAEDRLTEQLESLEPGWRTDNLAMPGWGVDLMIRALERYGEKADPDIVVLAIFTGDFTRLLPYFAGMGYSLPKFRIEGSELVTVPFPSVSFWERSRLVQLLYRARWSVGRDRYDLHEALLNRFRKDAREIGFTPVVMFLPGRGETRNEHRRRDFLERWTTQNHIQYLDLTEAVRNAGAKIYLRGTFHWNRAGYAIAAAELRRFLHRLSIGKLNSK